MKKVLITLIVSILLSLLLFFLFIPSILSSQIGKQFLVRSLEQQTGGSVSIGTASFNWTHPQSILNFSLKKPGELSFHFESLILETSFWNLLVRNGNIGHIKLVDPEMTLYPPSQRSSSSQKKLRTASTTSKEEVSHWSNFWGNLEIEGGKISTISSQNQWAELNQIHLTLSVPHSLFPFSIDFHGKTKSDDSAGSFAVKGVVERDEDLFELEATATVSHFPVASIDALSSFFAPKMKGIFLDTFGQTLSLNLTCSKKKSQENLSLHLHTSNAHLSLLAHYQNQTLTLQNPLEISWIAKPDVLHMLLPLPHVKFRGNTPLHVTIDRLTLPLERVSNFPEKIDLEANVHIEQGALSLGKTDEALLVDQFDLLVKSNPLDKTLTCQLQNQFRLNGLPKTRVQAEALISDQFRQEKLRAVKTFDFSCYNFPTKLLESFSPKAKRVTEWLGSTFDVTAEKFQGQRDHKFSISLLSPLIHLSNTSFTLTDQLTLDLPAEFSYQLSPSHFQLLASPTTILGKLEEFKSPLSWDWKDTEWKLSLEGQDLETPFGLLPLLKGEAKKAKGAPIGCELNSLCEFKLGLWQRAFFGERLNARLSGTLDLAPSFAISPCKVQLEGKNLNTCFEATLASHTFTLKKPLVATWTLDPKLINHLIADRKEIPFLLDPTQVTLTVHPTIFPLKQDFSSELDLKVKGEIPSLHTTLRETEAPLELEQVDLNFLFKGSQKISHLQIDASASSKAEIGVSIENTTGELNPLQNPSHVSVHFHQVPTPIGDALFLMKGTLSDLAGNWIDLELDFSQSSKGNTLELNLRSPYLKAEGAFQIEDRLKLLKGRPPLKIEWNVSEKGYLAYKKWRDPTREDSSPFQIKDRALLKLSLESLSFPLPLEKFQFNQAAFSGQMKIHSLVFQQKTGKEEGKFNHLDFHLSKKEEAPLIFKIEGALSTQGLGKKGLIQGSGQLDHFVSSKGTLDFEDLTASVHLDIQHLPTVFLDALSNFSSPSSIPPSAFLGHFLNGSFDTELIEENGKLQAQIDASNFQTSLDATVANGCLSLNEPLRAKMTVSEKMNQYLSKNAKITIESVKNPIELFISDQGFSTSIKSLDFDQMKLSHGVIDFGQLTCQNRGTPSEINTIFKIKGNQHLISLWFAPMEFKIREGLISIDRTEILYNHFYEIALWGDLNFRRQSVDMILGLTSQSLRAALGIQGLDSQYVLQVPIQGKFDHIKIDKSRAISKIALLIARKQMAPQSGVWGQVFGAIGDLADDQSNVPRAKPPFPWENVVNLKEMTTTDKELKKRFKKKEKAYKREIEKFKKPF
jgi:hypothetical protein